MFYLEEMAAVITFVLNNPYTVSLLTNERIKLLFPRYLLIGKERIKKYLLCIRYKIFCQIQLFNATMGQARCRRINLLTHELIQTKLYNII